MNLTLPVPLSVNRLYDGRVYKRAYTDSVRWQHSQLDPLAGNVAVRLDVYRPRKSGDLDNYLKLLLDTLQGMAYQNDNQIVEIHAYRHDDKRNPRAEVTITPVSSIPVSRGLRLELARKHSMIRVRSML